MIKRKIIGLALLLSAWSLGARPVNLQMNNTFMASTFDVMDASAGLPGQTVLYLNSVQTSGYLFSDIRLQNVGPGEWMFRTNLKGRAVFNKNRYEPELRTAYVENKKPVFNHLYFLAGRMISPYMIPKQRMDGGHIAFTPGRDSHVLFGVAGGRIPVEFSAYRDLYQPANRVGAFFEFNGHNADSVKVQYNTGFETGKTSIHQGQLQFVKNFNVFSKEIFFRGGALYTLPQNVLDYGYFETGINWSNSIRHSLSVLNADTIYVISASQTEHDHLHEYTYRFFYSPAESLWRINVNLGYADALGGPGYNGQVSVNRRNLFSRYDNFSVMAVSRKRGYYNQHRAELGYALPLLVTSSRFLLGFEQVMYKNINTSSLLYGVQVSSDLSDIGSFDVNVEIRHMLKGSLELYAQATFFNHLSWNLGRQEE